MAYEQERKMESKIVPAFPQVQLGVTPSYRHVENFRTRKRVAEYRPERAPAGPQVVGIGLGLGQQLDVHAWSLCPSDGSANGVSKNSANRSFKNAINAGSNA